MNFEPLDIWIVVVIVVLAVVGFAVFRLRKKKETGVSSGKQFLSMGIIWVLFGLGYSFWRGGNPFDIGLFNLGLIFTVAGGAQLLIERFSKKRL